MTKAKERKGRPLPAARLRAVLDPAKVPYGDSRDIPDRNGHTGFQPRAKHALEMALRIRGLEYNIYVSGEVNLGRTYFVRDILEPAAAKAKAPDDWVYLHNFEDPDKPLAISLPAGEGRCFRTMMQKAVADLRTQMATRFDQDQFQKKRDALFRGFTRTRDKLMEQMETLAGSKGFAIDYTESGNLTLNPLDKDGKPLNSEAEPLDAARRGRLKSKASELLAEINDYLRQLGKNEADLKSKEDDLYRDAARAVVRTCLEAVRSKHGANERLTAYFDALEADVLENLDPFLPREQAKEQVGHTAQDQAEDTLARYDVNLFVDNSGSKGAPVILEAHPTNFNLLGAIEREAELGALYTDFTLIRSGSIHRANGGFLLMNVDDLLTNPSSWEGLVRALRTGQSRIEDPVDQEQVRARTIEPEPIPLSLKVVLVGTELTYETLLYHDDRFGKLFKLKAQMQDTAPRTMGNIRRYINSLGRIIREAALPPFTREALAALVDHSSRLCEDQKRLSLEFPLLRECMIESAALAEMDNRHVVDGKDITAAFQARSFRSNLYEEEYLNDYDREIIKVSTEGAGAGVCNGLSVSLFGDYEFGLPHQISCTTGVGHGGIIDLEREAQLGGPIHTKGMMIIKSYLVSLFAQDKPIVLSGSLCFEQSYAGIEGDSASGAELAALLSSLSGVANDLSLAFTGAVSQSGAIMAVGGVNRKIEGFFEVCRRRGLSGEQGVILPQDNVVNLMLKPEVVEAVDKGKFHIYPVRTIEEAMNILTGLPSGARGKNGRYPKGTLYRLVDDRLSELADLARCRESDREKRGA